MPWPSWRWSSSCWCGPRACSAAACAYEPEMSPRQLLLAVIAGLIALFAIPLLTDNEYVLALGFSFAAMSVLAGGLNLIYGYTGLLSFAQVGFFGIGAYTAVLLVVDAGWSLWAGVVAGGALCVLVGRLVGYSALRLSRHAF